jgi:hypothetical protein
MSLSLGSYQIQFNSYWLFNAGLFPSWRPHGERCLIGSTTRHEEFD